MELLSLTYRRASDNITIVYGVRIAQTVVYVKRVKEPACKDGQRESGIATGDGTALVVFRRSSQVVYHS